MIVQLRGILLESSPLSAIVDAGGIGYHINIPITTAERLPGVGKECLLFIHAVYREDSQTLYGFADRGDRDFFCLLIEKVSGIGPKIAITILSRMSVETLKSAIAQGDVALLSKCPGIGRKTAERVVIELKDKVFPGGIGLGAAATGNTGVAGPAGGGGSSAFQDTVSSLVILGYKPADADKMARQALHALGGDATTEALLKRALNG
jgi:Holliday junction DNA helicase RuvA